MSGVRDATTYLPPTNVPPQIAGTATSRPKSTGRTPLATTIVRRSWLAFRDEVPVAEPRLAVAERLALEAGHATSRGGEHGVPGGGVPLHRGPETRVDVRFTGRHEAELERRTDGAELGYRVVSQERVGLGRAV